MVDSDATAAAVDPAAFRAALGGFATGVGVMTTVVDDVPHGMTASAVSSVSLHPSLVLVCVDRQALMADRVVRSEVFALSFLAREQRHVSDRFATPTRGHGHVEFEGIPWRTETTGSPVLEGVVSWVDCRVWSVADGGDHLIVVGEALALGSTERAPLLYLRGGYGGYLPDEG